MPSGPWVRLSEADLWGGQRSFYEGLSRREFLSRGIPFHITSCPAISYAYASMAAAWIGDWCRKGADGSGGIDPEQPVHILELGPGTGQFTFLFTQDLRRLLDSKGLGHLRTRHICADIGTELLNDIAGHEKIIQFADEGLLDFAVFDMTDPRSPFLMRAKETLPSQIQANPLIVILNYVLDSVPQDCFVVREGQLFESLVQTAEGPETAPRLRFEQRPVTMPYYGDQELDRVLDACRADEGVILFPTAGLKLLRWIWEFSGGRLLMLMADKGYDSASEVSHPTIEFHAENCISMMVYLGAIREFWVGRGGRFHAASREGAALSLVAAEAGLKSREAAGLQQSFVEHVEDCSPEDWETLSWRTVRDADVYSVAEILACLRLSRWDSAVFRDFFPALFRRLATMPEFQKEQAAEAARRCLERYYHIGESSDLVFKGASMLYELKHYAEALTLFNQSRGHGGPQAATSFQIGRCLYQLGRTAEALKEIYRALDMDPNFEDYLLGTGFLLARCAVELAAKMEWEISH